LCMPLILVALAVPDHALLASRLFFGLYLGVVYFTLFFAELAGVYFFRFYDFRPNYLVFEHGADREVLKTVAKAYPLVRIVLLSLTGAGLALNPVQLLAPVEHVGAVRGDALWLWDRGVSFVWLLFAAFASRGTFDHR